MGDEAQATCLSAESRFQRTHPKEKSRTSTKRELSKLLLRLTLQMNCVRPILPIQTPWDGTPNANSALLKGTHAHSKANTGSHTSRHILGDHTPRPHSQVTPCITYMLGSHASRPRRASPASCGPHPAAGTASMKKMKPTEKMNWLPDPFVLEPQASPAKQHTCTCIRWQLTN